MCVYCANFIYHELIKEKVEITNLVGINNKKFIYLNNKPKVEETPVYRRKYILPDRRSTSA